MNGIARVAAIAATVVVVAVGGLYLAGVSRLGGPGGTNPTEAPSPSAPPPPVVSIGTITLQADGCTWEDKPGSIAAQEDPHRATVRIRNETDTFANFGIFLLDAGFPYAEAEAWIQRENDALHGGPSQPPQDFATEIASLDAPDPGEQLANLALEPGVYGIVCSSNEPPPGEVFAVYVVGPLEITGP